MTTVPQGYVELSDGVRCRCIKEFTAPNGTHWCCNHVLENNGENVMKESTPKTDALFEDAKAIESTIRAQCEALATTINRASKQGFLVNFSVGPTPNGEVTLTHLEIFKRLV